MRAQIIYIFLLCIFSFDHLKLSGNNCVTGEDFANTTIFLEDDIIRYKLQNKKLHKEYIEVCDFIPGEWYDIRMVQKSGCNNNISLFYQGENVTKLELQAEFECLTFEIEYDVENPDCLEPLFLSVAGFNKKADDPLSKMLANLSVSTNSNCTDLIENHFIAGGCFDVAGVTCIGPGAGKGTFSNGTTNVGFESGVILSSGPVTSAPGPNNSGGGGGNIGGGSDPDLALLGSGVDDAVGIEFDFTPTLETINFNYVFASEEYCEFVDAGFNDVFGFFISGPGINGGFMFDGINIALIPGTTLEVAINTVNHEDNTEYFNPNSPTCGGTTNMTEIQYDGYTTVLTATANVTACETYHIRLVVGDRGDAIYNSAVFLEGNSFNAGATGTGEGFSAISGSNIVYEDCADGAFVFEIDEANPTDDVVITFNVDPSSTATEGDDYDPLPNSVTIPAGETTVTLPINVIADGIPEGDESIIILIENACSCDGAEVEIIITDPDPLLVELPDQTICGTGTVTLTPNVSGGVLGTYEYEWEDGSTGPSISVTPTEETTYSVTVTDDCGLEEVAQATVTVGEPPTAEISGSFVICAEEDSPSIEVPINFTGTAPWIFSYSVGGTTYGPITTSENPHIETVTLSGTMVLTNVESDLGDGACPGTVMGQVDISEVEVTASLDGTSETCAGFSNGTLTATPGGGLSPYTYAWSNGAGNVPSQTNVEPGPYTVTITDDQGCSGTATFNIDSPPMLEAFADGTEANCNSGGNGSISVSANGGTPNYSYSWSNGSTSPTQSNVPPGTYEVTVTDLNGCTAFALITVDDNTAPPEAFANGDGVINCYQSTMIIDGFNSSTGGNITYNWSGPGIVSGGNTLTPTIDAGGTYTILVTDLNSGCTADASVTIPENLDEPVATATGSELDCNNDEISISGSGSSTGSDFVYTWTGPGIVSGGSTLDPVVNIPGTYFLTVTNSVNGCTAMTSAVVGDNTAIPAAQASADDLNCNNSQITISGNGSETGAGITYQWSGPGIVSGGSTLNPSVDQPGQYWLTVTNTNNGCTNTVPIFVNEDITPPQVFLNEPPTLGCQNEDIDLLANGTSIGSGIIYNWSTTDGNITGNTNTINTTANEPGTYTLLVTNLNNGCTAEASVTVSEEIILPEVQIANPDIVDCNNNLIFLDGSSSSTGPEFIYTWITLDGNIVNGNGTTNPQVDEGGTYTLIVANLVTGCTNEASIVVNENTEEPNANAGLDQMVTCNQQSATLNASASDIGGNYTLEWLDPFGSSLGNNTQITVSTPGTYQVVITDLNNGCTAVDEVNVEANDDIPVALINTPAQLNCFNSTITINANSFSNPISVEWSTFDGSIISGENTLTPVVDEPGTYNLVLTNTNSGCTSTYSISVSENIDIPEIEILDPDFIDCSNQSVLIDASNSSTGNNLNYTWTTLDGLIISGENTLTPVVAAGGTYLLNITNTSNACQNANSVIVTDFIEYPEIEIQNPDLFTCTTEDIVLNAVNSSVGANLNYSWTTNGGTILAGEDSLEPVVGSPGSYTLTIVNTANNCVSMETIEVEADSNIPVADAGPAALLDCLSESLVLNGEASGGTNLNIEWTTSDGNILNGDDSLFPEIDAPGTYILNVTNIDNDCTASSQVIIDEDISEPIALIAPTDIISCNDPTLILDASQSDDDFNLIIEWTTTDGNILNGEDSLFPEIDAGGTYVLTISNPNNNCNSTTEITVEENSEIPTANAGLSQTMGCGVSSLTLSGTASSNTNPLLDIAWSTQSGNILSGADDLNPEVDEAGIYTLTVSDPLNGCFATSSVEIFQDTTTPEITMGDGGEITCVETEFTLNATVVGNTQNYVYEWTSTEGNIAEGESTLNPIVDAAGEYQLVVTDTINGCTDIASVQITEDANIPEAIVEAEGGLNCISTALTLDASQSTSGMGITFSWSTDNGNFVADSNTLTPTINAPGLYTLTIFDANNNCTNSAGLSIEMDTLAPSLSISNGILTCDTEELILDASSSDSLSNQTIEWTTIEGNFINGTDGLTPLINEPGEYTLTLTNEENGCVSSIQTTVIQEIQEPVINIETPDEINCASDFIVLDAQGSDNNGIYSLEWSTVDGNILNGENTTTPSVTEPGVYSLLITNSLNGCTSEDQIEVIENSDYPELQINPAAELNCVVESMELDASNSSTGGAFEYLWTNDQGLIIENETSLNPSISNPGIYVLTISNITNECITIDSIQVSQDITDPIAESGQPFELNCEFTEANLDGSLSSLGDEITYQWTTQDGQIINGENSTAPLINEPGTYVLSVLNNENGCTAVSEVEITQNIVIPNVDAGIAINLTCITEEVTLNGENSDSGDNISYSWGTTDGNIVSGENGLNPIVNEPGVYTLTILDSSNMCSNTSEVEVIEDLEEPVANAGEDQQLDCLTELIILDGEGSSQGQNFTYQWSSNNATILSGENDLTPTINEPGDYDLLVTNVVNGCTSSDAVLIIQNLETPTSSITQPDLLTCSITQINLNGELSSQGNEFEYFWSTDDGNIVDSSDPLNPIINEPGNYELLVLNNVNGCTEAFEVVVNQDVEAPSAEAGEAEDLTCNTTTISLDGAGSSEGNDYTYEWSSTDGNIVNGQNSLAPTINFPGTYTILVTDNTNGCTTEDFVLVEADDAIPFSVIADPGQLTCAIESIILDGSPSSPDPSFGILWTTSNGLILSGETTLNPEIGAPGSYTLIVTDDGNGCTSESSVMVTQDIAAPSVQTNDDFVFNCYDPVQYLNGEVDANGAAVSYEWTTQNGTIVSGELSSNLGIGSGGTYSLIVTNLSNGCSAMDLVTVIENEPVASSELIQPRCFEDPGAIMINEVIGGTPPYLYSIDGGNTYSNSQFFSNLPAGVYELTVQDLNGCEDNQTVELIEPDDILVEVAEPEVTVKLGESYQIQTLTNIPETEIAEIIWTPIDNLSCPDCLNPVVTPDRTTLYNVEVKNLLGCKDAAPFLIRINKQSEIYAPNIFSPNGDGNNDRFFIQTNDKGVQKIKSFLVFNRWGETVYQYYDFFPNDPAYGWDGTHRGDEMNPAVFVWFAEIEFIDGRTEILEGDVTLVK